MAPHTPLPAADQDESTAEPHLPPREPRVQVARNFAGSDFGRFEFLRTVSAGGAALGKVDIDCKLRLSQSLCGVLGRDHQPAVVLYMDLAFRQPSDCRLERASVTITLGDHHPAGPAPAPALAPDSALSMTDAFGPFPLCGPLKRQAGSDQTHWTPFFDYAGFGFGGVGRSRTKLRLHERRWSFAGDLVRPRGRAFCSLLRRGGPGPGPGAYRSLRWDLEENAFDRQPLRRRVFHTAFVFEHDAAAALAGVPVVLRVDVDGKLRRSRDRLRQQLLSFPAPGGAPGVARTLLDLSEHYPPAAPNRTRLDLLAQRLPAEMTEMNRKNLPHEVGDGGGSSASTGDAVGELLGDEEEAAWAAADEEPEIPAADQAHLLAVGMDLLRPASAQGRGRGRGQGRGQGQGQDPQPQPEERDPGAKTPLAANVLAVVLPIVTLEAPALGLLASWLRLRLYGAIAWCIAAAQAITIPLPARGPPPPRQPLPEMVEQPPPREQPLPGRPPTVEEVPDAAPKESPSRESQDNGDSHANLAEGRQRQREPRRPPPPSISSHASSSRTLVANTPSASTESAASAAPTLRAAEYSPAPPSPSCTSCASDESEQAARLRKLLVSASAMRGWARGGKKGRLRARRVEA